MGGSRVQTRPGGYANDDRNVCVCHPGAGACSAGQDRAAASCSRCQTSSPGTTMVQRGNRERLCVPCRTRYRQESCYRSQTSACIRRSKIHCPTVTRVGARKVLSEIPGPILGRSRDSVILRLHRKGQTTREMIEVIAALIRWLVLASNMILVGGCVFLAIAERERAAFNNAWFVCLKRTLPWLAVTLLLSLLGLLSTTTAQITGVAENAWHPGAWLELLQKTRIGLIWTWRTALALLLFGVALFVRFSHPARWQSVLCATVAALTLAVGSLASHSAAGDLSVTSVLPYTLHIVLASMWFGGLPAFLTILYANTGKRSRKEAHGSDIQTLKRFSKMALPVMIAVVATGIIVADRMIDTSYAALFATSYGWFLNAKIALLAVILVIAARARFIWMPRLSLNSDEAAASGQGLRRWVTIEVALAAALVLAATLLANAVPAKHAVIEDWPYSFRLSIDATWGQLSVMIRTV